MTATWWVCGYGHVFSWGDKDWHADVSQPGGAPMYCTAAPCGEPCMDSAHLFGPYATEADAVAAKPSLQRQVEAWRGTPGWRT